MGRSAWKNDATVLPVGVSKTKAPLVKHLSLIASEAANNSLRNGGSIVVSCVPRACRASSSDLLAEATRASYIDMVDVSIFFWLDGMITICQPQTLATVRWLAEVNDLRLVRSCWGNKYQVWAGNTHHFCRAVNRLKGAEAVQGKGVSVCCYRCLTAMPASVDVVPCPGCGREMAVFIGGL